MSHPDRVLDALTSLAEDGLLADVHGAPKWAMPRDMSGFSDLEAAMLAVIQAKGLPEPVAEYRFAPPCCAHPKGKHSETSCYACIDADVASRPDGWPNPDGLTFHKYDAGRKWRFDFAWPDRMLAVECEGGTWSGGRHTSGAGFEKDAEKYSEAAIRGWAVLRFTGGQITSGHAIEAVERAMNAGR